MPTQRLKLAAQYQALLADIYQGCAEVPHPTLPPEQQRQGWWAAGYLPTQAETLRHGSVRILERGRWNHKPGPDFTHAEIEIGGIRYRGDIEIDTRVQDWEAHGHGSNPDFNNVVLHVVFTPPPAGWYTRDSQHRDIAILYLPPEAWQDLSSGRRSSNNDSLPRCRIPLANASPSNIISLLKAAAAYRLETKRKRFLRRVQAAGASQAWYEAWAVTLGYSANKEAMQMLALRAPIKDLGTQAEAILLGTAGFLKPVLPPQTSDAARDYHRRVWDSWWLRREQYELSANRELPWCKAPSRPLNHPQRRVAALAVTAHSWQHLLPHMNAEGALQLARALNSITHPFWDYHYTLSAAPMKQGAALVGKQRIQDFLINHVYAYDASAYAWETYLSQRAGSTPEGIKRTARLLFGERTDLSDILKYSYAQQALLQIDADFCTCNICLDCAFPVQLQQWAKN